MRKRDRGVLLAWVTGLAGVAIEVAVVAVVVVVGVGGRWVGDSCGVQEMALVASVA
jgi:hypothetical protein